MMINNIINILKIIRFEKLTEFTALINATHAPMKAYVKQK